MIKMTIFRKILFWLHLAAGITAGSIVLIMSATGVLLTYEKQMLYWADTRAMNAAPPAAGAERLPSAALVERATRVFDGKPTSVRWRADVAAPAEVVFGREGTVYLNAYTGETLGMGATALRAFFRKVTELHRYIGATDEHRERGKSITGAANLLFLFIVVSGLYLWFPRNWSKRAFANVMRFRRGLTPKARDFNWHNVIGFWSLVPLFIVVISATVISYPWASDLAYRIVGDTPPPRPSETASPEKKPEKPAAEVSSSDLLAHVSRVAPDWRTATLTLQPGKDGITVAIERGYAGQPHKRVTLTADPQTLAVKKVEAFGDLSSGRRLRSILRFAHTGEVLGIPGQTVAGVVTAGSLVLVYTGISLAIRRLWSWLRRRRYGTGNDKTGQQMDTAA